MQKYVLFYFMVCEKLNINKNSGKRMEMSFTKTFSITSATFEQYLGIFFSYRVTVCY